MHCRRNMQQVNEKRVTYCYNTNEYVNMFLDCLQKKACNGYVVANHVVEMPVKGVIGGK